jgi:Rrf2 family protein
MKITYKGDYALKAVLALAENYGQEIITIHELAARIDAPIKFLEQVLLDLKQGGFVESRRGKVGGYMLARAPSQIRLGEVVRFVDGPIEPISCCERRYAGCKDMYSCAFRDIWHQVSESTALIIDGVTFEDILERSVATTPADTYII